MFSPTCLTRSLRERNEFLFRFAKQKLAFFIWGGKQVIKADSLSDESVEEGAVVLTGQESETVQRYRDVLKSCVIKRGEGASYVLLGIESQESIHYAMPVRTMVYDALQYDKTRSLCERYEFAAFDLRQPHQTRPSFCSEQRRSTGRPRTS